MSYLTSNKENVHVFVESCVQAGLTNVVICPGSRNAPLTISFDEHPDIQCFLIHDERSAAFFAMGMALQIQKPVAVVCTSGSAVLNYFPAVAEAFYQNIPLVVISADRPAEWINHGDGQTIMQDHVFGRHVLGFEQLSDADESENHQIQIATRTHDLLRKAMGNSRGPVHFNFALEEPLYGTREVGFDETQASTHPTPSTPLSRREIQDIDPTHPTSSTPLSRRIIGNKKQISTPLSPQENDDIDPMISTTFHPMTERSRRHRVERSRSLTEIWSQATKKMVLIGQMPKNEALLQELKTLADDPSVLIMVENTSNLYDLRFVHCVDRTIEHLDKNDANFIPEILVTLGGAIVSKKIKTLLRNWPIQAHWRVGYDFPEMDTYRKMTASFEMKPTTFIRKINEAPRNTAHSYAPKWKALDFQRQERTLDFCEAAPWSDLKVFHLLLDCLPENSTLHLGNSSVVRYAQLFDPISSVVYQSNRGTSGIDGSMSTAAGAAAMDTDTWHVHFTGDISFFYDSNALWNQHLTPNLRIFVINNSGGGIFKIIPGPKSTAQYEKYFVAKHEHSAEHICKAFDVDYFKANNEDELLEKMEAFYTHEADGRPKLMEIFTDSGVNDGVLEGYFGSLKKF